MSLLPRVHLAIVHFRILSTALHQVFAEAISQSYLLLVTGPGRSSGTELVMAIGAKGPLRQPA